MFPLDISLKKIILIRKEQRLFSKEHRPDTLGKSLGWGKSVILKLRQTAAILKYNLENKPQHCQRHIFAELESRNLSISL